MKTFFVILFLGKIFLAFPTFADSNQHDSFGAAHIRGSSTEAMVHRLALLTLWFPATSLAQTKKIEPPPMTRVPLVRCRNYAGSGGGPDGELPATKEKYKEVQMDAAVAGKLVYYLSPMNGVLAPSGWSCIGYSGTSGGSLFVTPRPIKRGAQFDGIGPAVILNLDDGTTSGRFGVAGVIARFFPAHKKFLDGVIKEGLRPLSEFPLGPYPHDKLTPLSDSAIEIQTPSNSDGFETEVFKKNDDPIHGAVILLKDGDGTEESAIRLYIRLQKDGDDLASQIVRQFEALKSSKK